LLAIETTDVLRAGVTIHSIHKVTVCRHRRRGRGAACNKGEVATVVHWVRRRNKAGGCRLQSLRLGTLLPEAPV
jgi:hypothetical protein